MRSGEHDCALALSHDGGRRRGRVFPAFLMQRGQEGKGTNNRHR